MNIVKEVKRSDVLWRFACGDVYCCVLHWGNFGIQYCCTHFMFLNRLGELKLIQHLINCSLFIQVFLTLLQNRKSPIFLLVGSHSLFRLHILALGLYSYEQQSAEATHFETHLHRKTECLYFLKKVFWILNVNHFT